MAAGSGFQLPTFKLQHMVPGGTPQEWVVKSKPVIALPPAMPKHAAVFMPSHRCGFYRRMLRGAQWFQYDTS
jgi:hypothetical protein